MYHHPVQYLTNMDVITSYASRWRRLVAYDRIYVAPGAQFSYLDVENDGVVCRYIGQDVTMRESMCNMLASVQALESS
jgi:hypothetical protein